MRNFNAKHFVGRCIVIVAVISIIAVSVFNCNCLHGSVEAGHKDNISFNNLQHQVETECCHHTDSPENSCQTTCKKLNCVFSREQNFVLEQKQSVLAFISLPLSGFIARDLAGHTFNAFIEQKINTDINPAKLCVFRC